MLSSNKRDKLVSICSSSIISRVSQRFYQQIWYYLERGMFQKFSDLRLAKNGVTRENDFDEVLRPSNRDSRIYGHVSIFMISTKKLQLKFKGKIGNQLL